MIPLFPGMTLAQALTASANSIGTSSSLPALSITWTWLLQSTTAASSPILTKKKWISTNTWPPIQLTHRQCWKGWSTVLCVVLQTEYPPARLQTYCDSYVPPPACKRLGQMHPQGNYPGSWCKASTAKPTGEPRRKPSHHCTHPPSGISFLSPTIPPKWYPLKTHQPTIQPLLLWCLLEKPGNRQVHSCLLLTQELERLSYPSPAAPSPKQGS